MDVACAAFGRKFGRDDIYKRLIEPKKLLLLQGQDRILAFAGYNTKYFMGRPSLIVEDVAMVPEVQGKGVFAAMTERAAPFGYSHICLVTQNPRMLKALDNFCQRTYPSGDRFSGDIGIIKSGFVDYLGCDVMKNGVIKGYYDGLLYGEVPHHRDIDLCFKGLGVDLNNGDAILAVGELNNLCSNTFYWGPKSKQDKNSNKGFKF